jgi:hypothetical protein
MANAFISVVVWFFFALFKSLMVYIIGWSHFPIGFWANITSTTKFNAYVWTWNSMCHLGATKIDASKYHCFMASHASWHFAVHSNTFVFHKSFMMGAIMKAKFLIKHRLNWAIPLKTCMSFSVFNGHIHDCRKVKTHYSGQKMLSKIIIFSKLCNFQPPPSQY